ncbi:CU044_5270 family protein [Nonomuraea sp. NPDC048916]|uniref:CU044_5270 family protein n=1 Tax=Nonomuraea sp. NPDC048916 TaxID=3154232 RepID=UPI0033CB0778
MDELRRIRDLYGDPRPDPAAEARVRARLAAEPRRVVRRRLSWTAAVACLAAAVVAVAFALPSGGDLSGRSILLAAATTAASGPASGGTYWHIRKLRPGTEVTELWVARDGRAWRGRGAPGEPLTVTRVTGGAPFSMAGRDLTLEQILRLPSDAGALREWAAGALPAGSGGGVMADALSGLLWSKPSPPGVRAAAYRLLADLPDVRYLGGRTDQRGRPGEAFSFTPGPGVRRTLIIDPASSRVLSCADTGPDGASERLELVLEAGWTDTAPPTPDHP